ncbi:hypothetical protein BHE74_00007336 [Ensete ventricosum]|nr:hypothetical protein BHE74_00007336 [Ensete ventricosum]
MCLVIRIVESVGEGVTDLAPGDHVLPVFTGECKECAHCLSEESNMCNLLRINTDRGVMLSDGQSRFSIKGKPINHFLGTSTFSEYTVVHSGCVAKINPLAPLDKVCVLSCGFSTGESTSTSSFKFNALHSDIVASNIAQGWGVAVLVGVPHKDAVLKTHPVNFLNERTLKGTFFGNYKPRSDLPSVVERYMNKVASVGYVCVAQEIELEKFITHEVTFSEINKAFDYMLQGASLRCIIRMDG